MYSFIITLYVLDLKTTSKVGGKFDKKVFVIIFHSIDYTLYQKILIIFASVMYIIFPLGFFIYGY